ncbi:hypothetical protein N9Y92_04125, partial [Chlamydiales bacterium]|nr:hypothetical protein [Chlamydiales bacterium]
RRTNTEELGIINQAIQCVKIIRSIFHDDVHGISLTLNTYIGEDSFLEELKNPRVEEIAPDSKRVKMGLLIKREGELRGFSTKREKLDPLRNKRGVSPLSPYLFKKGKN